MIEKMEITSIKTEVKPDLEKYINKKIGRLDRFLPRHARRSAHAQVTLRESGRGKVRNLMCEVTLNIPDKVLTAKETSTNMFSSVDIVESKLTTQLRKYKDMHTSGRSKRLARKVVGRFRR
ncbi:ribosome-associated translation inhibitor RaiA [Candidatus Saccharibacteria bacterium]|nr:ribosome-associated translation inhibitor RaiA [Candidatus Saccharibacteria bacterium]MCB9821348.1 ribosome-associated translation inhibitor RaiA [Candidatus Nomurabacteria bacterium]